MTVGVTVKKHPASLLAVLLAASISLAGCGGDSEADTSPPSTSTSSPPTTSSSAPTTRSASPAAAAPRTDPNIPAEARAHTPAGAEAFVRYFIEQLNVAWTTPRAGLLRPLCQASAKACAAYERTAARLIAEGHRYDGDPLTVKFIGTLDATNSHKYDVLANLVQERRSQIDADGKTHVTDKREDFRVNFELLYRDHAWSASSINLMK